MKLRNSIVVAALAVGAMLEDLLAGRRTIHVELRDRERLVRVTRNKDHT